MDVLGHMNATAHLNALRAKAGMKPIKAWKESKAKLQAAIAKLEAASHTKQTDAKLATAITNAKTKTSAKAKAKSDRGPGRPRDEELAAYVKSQGYTGKSSRIAFRKAGLHGPYTLNAQTKAALKE